MSATKGGKEGAVVRVPFVPRTQENRAYVPRAPAPGGPITLSRNTSPSASRPSGSAAEATQISLERSGQGGEVDSPEQVAWLEQTFAGLPGLRAVWDGEWEIDEPAHAAAFEARLAEVADLHDRMVQTVEAASVATLLGARPSAVRTEELEWLLRWLPGLEARPPRYATVLVVTSGRPSRLAAYGAVYPHDDGGARPSDWLRAQVGEGREAARPRRDPAGRAIEGFALDAGSCARLLEAMVGLPADAVERFTARWSGIEPIKKEKKR